MVYKSEATNLNIKKSGSIEFDDIYSKCHVYININCIIEDE